MERIDQLDGQPLDSLSDLVGRVEPGDEVVVRRDGKVVAEFTVPTPPVRRPVFDRASLARIHALLGDDIGGGAAMIREMRDADEH